MAERAIVVVPAIYRGESGGITSNILLFVIGWESPTFRTNIVGGVISIGALAVSTSRCGTEVVVTTVGGVAANSRICVCIAIARS